MGGPSKGVCLEGSPQVSLLVGLVVPLLVSPVQPELSASSKTARLSYKAENNRTLNSLKNLSNMPSSNINGTSYS